MLPQAFRLFSLFLWLSAFAASGQSSGHSLTERAWFEARTAHFDAYSCGTTQQVSNLLGRLEQFREAYYLLAGAQAVASPPIVVMAFPNHESLRPFLPLYQGKPAHLSAFFIRGSDENLIALSLADSEPRSLEVVFHEYTHLLFRHNERFWPLWVKEGMAEIYSTFELTGLHTVRIGRPIEHHLRLLASRPLLPLPELFAVNHSSPDYNERDRQGGFYSESWLLTHYLMVADNGARKARFGQLTALLRQGQASDQAFTNAFHTTLPAMQAELRRYLERGKFASLDLTVTGELTGTRSMTTRPLVPVEIWCRLGNQLLRIDRLDSAESYFAQAQKIAPRSPLPLEGLGLLAAERGKTEESARLLREALQGGSISFLAHYMYAREMYKLTAKSPDQYSALDKERADPIRSELQKSVALMPDFGPAQHLLGFFEMVQGDDLSAAQQHLQKAIQLEPENPSYLLSLAQVQLRRNDPDAARRILEGLRAPYIDAELRAHAKDLLQQIRATPKDESGK
jgi:tetratricopeptide (TPR) repeat protein